MSGFDKYAYNSKLSPVSTSDKLCFVTLPLVVCLIANSYLVNLVIFAVMSFCTVSLGGINLRTYTRLLLIPSAFLMVGTLTIMISHLGGSASQLSSITVFGQTYGVTRESLTLGFKLFMKSMASIACLYFFSLNTPMNSFFNYLRKIKFPTVLIELMELMYRFIFVVWSEANKIYVAQSSRLGYRSFRISLRSLGALGSTIFLKSFKRAEKVNIALESRGYNGRLEGLIMEEIHNPALRYSGIIISLGLVVIAIIEKVIL